MQVVGFNKQNTDGIKTCLIETMFHVLEETYQLRAS